MMSTIEMTFEFQGLDTERFETPKSYTRTTGQEKVVVSQVPRRWPSSRWLEIAESLTNTSGLHRTTVEVRTSWEPHGV
jgi:hypothetical protein